MDRLPTIEQLAEWLIEEGYAEEVSGYGHVDGETLAEALLDQFEMINKDKYFSRS